MIKGLLKLFLGQRLPQHTGQITVPGLYSKVTIHRDGYGVPYIYAHDDADGWFGLGFCHAQDRPGQMEFLVRTIRGTLSEVAGSDTLPIDRLSRRIGFKRAAARQMKNCEGFVSEQLAAYAAGVNAGLQQGLPKRSHEHVLLGCSPTLWEAGDSLAFAGLLCFALASNWDMELLRLKILLEDGPRALLALEPPNPAGVKLTAGSNLSDYAQLQSAENIVALYKELDFAKEFLGLQGGSNSWVLSGKRSVSGRPILANDAHLTPAAPALWYLARIETKSWKTCGTSSVGVPMMPAGHNGHIAWGITAAHADNTDLFIEQLGPDQTVRQGKRYKKCDVHTELIQVKGADPVTETILTTPRGPVISPALINGPGASVLSMSATWLSDRGYTGLFGVHKARSFKAFRSCYQKRSLASAAMVYADTKGNIGWQMTTDLPRRKKGSGLLPQPGWEPGWGWHKAPLPLSALPSVYNPKEGFAVMANSQPAKNGRHFYGLDWLDGYRYRRIRRRLSEQRKWTVAENRNLQLDTYSLPWEELRAVYLDAPAVGHVAKAQELLANWDGFLKPDSIQASIYTLALAFLIDAIIADVAPHSREWALGKGMTGLLPHNLIATRRLHHVVRLLKEQPDGIVHTSWPLMVSHALDKSWNYLNRHHGSDPTGWQWQKVRPIFLIHPLGEKKLFAKAFNIGPLKLGGDAGTIAQGSVDFNNPTGNAVGIPTMRIVMDVGAWENCRFSVAAGQSGNLFSKDYTSQLEAFESGEGIPIAWSEEQVQKRIRQTLFLEPL